MDNEKEPESKNCKSEFSRLKDICYLDHAATTLYSDVQIEAVVDDLKNNLYGNPHSLNLSSKYCHDSVDQIRFRILSHFGTTPNEYSVIFTSGATSALKSVVDWFQWSDFESKDDEDSHFVYTQDNHTSVLGLREILDHRVRVRCLNHLESFDVLNQNCDGESISKPELSRENNSLFVYPAQCNFSGCKYPLEWIENVRKGALDSIVSNPSRRHRWFCLLDAAAYTSCKLDLNTWKPDFVTVSFHKIFGYPTGLGALLVKNSSAWVMNNKSYYGGGTVLIAMSSTKFHVKKPTLHERCEDGTINYQAVLSLRHGFDTMYRIGGSMDQISKYTFSLTRYLHRRLTTLHHSNGKPVVVLYRDTDYSESSVQGNIVNFNLLRSNGEYIGYAEVLNIANLHNIHLRTGCFCNPGACQRHLNLSDEQLKINFQKGHTCADNIDLIDGLPTGSVRVSLGYMSDKHDVDELLNMIINCFVSKPVLIKVPEDWPAQSAALKSKFKAIQSTCINSIPTPTLVKDADIGKSNEIYEPIKCISEKKKAANLKLVKMFVYPIKSCGAFSVKSSWPISSTGLKYDREWMIVKNGVAVTQKHLPEMCMIFPTIDFENNQMFLRYKDSMLETPILLDINYDDNKDYLSSKICQSKVCTDRAEVIDCGDQVAHWLEEIFNMKGLRLVKLFVRNKSSYNEDNEVTRLSLANQAQYLLVTSASVQWLVDQMSSEWSCSFENVLQRFRSNFLIAGECQPLEEFTWNEIEIGSVRFKIDGPCQRCQMICVNQSSGEKSKEPLVILSSALKGKLKFGVYLSSTKLSEFAHLELNQTVIPILCNEN
ncbi:molybdenum cofactor sulfurase 3 [Planococcus citri]|uniref:molybdenum cofactor sulfurase 3 n=1 Tax=Planococcus citri TaxID=170843 RepID=UPI0031F839FD